MEPILLCKRDIFKRHEEGSSFVNHEVKRFLVEEFGDEIKICEPEQKNQSQFVFSSSVSVEDVVKSPRSLNAVKTAALEIRNALLKVDFGLDDRFCNAQELKDSLQNTKVPDVLLSFFQH